MSMYNVNVLFSDKKMQKEIPTKPGVYLITNTVNNKCYIGQAINLRNRLKSHISNYTNKRYDNPLYRAFNKYGLDKFTYQLLDVLEENDYKEARKQLDILEIKYIETYNSYNKGYNQTKGGDGGILGYKFTEKQIEKQKENTIKRINESLQCKIYLYDINNKYTYMFITPRYADHYFGWKENTTKNMIPNILSRKKYIVYRSDEEKQIKLNKLNSKEFNRDLYKNKYNKEDYLNLKKSYPNASARELATLLNVTVKTIYNYDKEFGINEFKSKDLVKFKILDTLSNDEYVLTVKEASKFFNISEDNSRRTLTKKSKDNSLYKKQYLISRINEGYEQID